MDCRICNLQSAIEFQDILGVAMPTFKFEAMDTTGGEVKDSVDATSEEEAQQKIRQMGYFVTRLTEVAGKKKKEKGKGPNQRKKGKDFTFGGAHPKTLGTFTPQLATLPAAPCPAPPVSKV